MKLKNMSELMRLHRARISYFTSYPKLYIANFFVIKYIIYRK